MTIVVIGANGFVGPYLINQLKSSFPGANLIGTYLEGTDFTSLVSTEIQIVPLDITDTSEVEEFLVRFKPDHLVNLAAQSSVSYSWVNPVLTFQVNVIGTLNLLQGVHKNNLGTRFLVIGSSEEYQSGREGITEKDSIEPVNPYGISKMTQEGLGRLFSKSYNIPVVMTRSFNHTGPGQVETFVIPDWCRQIALIEQGNTPPEISVGNLAVRRDFSHVADIVADYTLLMKRGMPGDAYNVGSGRSHSLKDILNTLINFSDSDITVSIDESKYRPAENEIISCDRSKLNGLEKTQYRPIDETLFDTLVYWRKKVIEA